MYCNTIHPGSFLRPRPEIMYFLRRPGQGHFNLESIGPFPGRKLKYEIPYVFLPSVASLSLQFSLLCLSQSSNFKYHGPIFLMFLCTVSSPNTPTSIKSVHIEYHLSPFIMSSSNYCQAQLGPNVISYNCSQYL